MCKRLSCAIPIGEEPPKEKILKAAIITTNGRRFEVENLRYRGKKRLDFFKGRNKRFIPLRQSGANRL